MEISSNAFKESETFARVSVQFVRLNTSSKVKLKPKG